MKTTIQVGTVGIDAELFSVTSTALKTIIEANKGCADAVNKSNLNYEIEINTNGLASFVPFSGLGNAWGTKFGFTFGMGDFDAGSELFHENGLFAMAKFFEGIQWRPHENMSGQELAAMACEGFAKRIAIDLHAIGLEVGRPVFPLVWNMSRMTGKPETYGVEDVTVTITPRLCGALYTSKSDRPEYHLNALDVVNALVFYASGLRRPTLEINEKPVALAELFKMVGSLSNGYNLLNFQAASFGHFVDRWPNVELLDSETTAVFNRNPHIVEAVDELLKRTINVSKAAVEIIHLFDAAYGIEHAAPEAVYGSIADR